MDTPATKADSVNPNSGDPQPVIVQLQSPSILRSCLMKFIFLALVISVLTNFFLLGTGTSTEGTTNEKFVSGDKSATDKIAIIPIVGTIMPPFTERVLGMIEDASEDDDVKGVILSIDSPGGLVAN